MTDRRPKTRAGCQGKPGGCAFVTCKHNLILNVGNKTKRRSAPIEHPSLGTWHPAYLESSEGLEGKLEAYAEAVVQHVEEGKPSCALDAEFVGPYTLDEIGVALGVSRERIRQIEKSGKKKLRAAVGDDIWVEAWPQPEGSDWDTEESLDIGDADAMRTALVAAEKKYTHKTALIDLVGKRFGRLTVLARVKLPAYQPPKWRVRCDCGVTKHVVGYALRNGATKSCGCLQREQSAKRFRKLNTQGETHGREGTKSDASNHGNR